MIYGLVPGNENVSWESHVLGAIAGLFCAIYFKPQKVGVNVRSEQEQTKKTGRFVQKGFYTFNDSLGVHYDYQEENSESKFGYSINPDTEESESEDV